MPEDSAVPQKDEDDKDKPKAAAPKPVGKTFTRRGVERQK